MVEPSDEYPEKIFTSLKIFRISSNEIKGCTSEDGVTRLMRTKSMPSLFEKFCLN